MRKDNEQMRDVNTKIKQMLGFSGKNFKELFLLFMQWSEMAEFHCVPQRIPG